jgi:hypothetical protein
MIASVARIGLLTGTTTCHRVRSVPAPSSLAASSRSPGMALKYSRSRKIPYGCPNT